MAITLRIYQTNSIEATFQAWRDGYRSVVLVCPTGSGKRLMSLWIMQYAADAGRKVLFVGNRRLLITQAQADAEKHEIPFGVIMADNECGDAAASNQLASIQSLESWYFYDKFSSIPTGTGLPPADLLIIDEVHQDGARYEQLLKFYPDAKVLGLTATPVGPEGTAIVPRLYDRLVEGVKNSELIRDGFLLPTTVYAPSEPNIEGVRLVKRGEYNQSQLGRAVQECTVFADVFSEWQTKASDRATVAFVPGIPFGRDLVRQFNFLLGPGSFYLIEAKTKHHEREEIFQKVRDGEAQGIVSVDVLKEGFDLPVLSAAIDLQPNSQLRSYWQKIGRIKRPFGSQTEAIYLDFAGNYWKFPHPNQDPEWPTGEETTQDTIKKARTKGEASQPIMCPQCGCVREGGAVCKGCGFRAEGAIRRIRMGNGKLKEIPAHAKEKVEKSESEKLFAKWQQRLFGALKSGISYAQCAEIFRRETGKYPLPHWVGVYPKDSVQAKQHPKRHFTPGQLAMACRKSPK